MLHCGHGFEPPSIQVPLCHEPLRSMASLPSGSHSVAMVVPMFLSSDCSGVGVRPCEKTLPRKPSESLKPCEPATHFFEDSS